MELKPEVQYGDFSLTNSLVNVDKEDLLREEADSDAGSVIICDHSICDSGDGDICAVADYVECVAVETTEKLELPEEFAKSVMESCREVEAVISALKPQAVFLELCSSRLSILTPQTVKEPPTWMEMIYMWKKKHNLFEIVYGYILAKACFCEANKYGGRVFLGDRSVQITLQRTWGKMPLWHKIKLVYSIVSQAVFLPNPKELEKMLKDLGDGDMLTLAIQEMSTEFPTLMETLVHERDKYMAYQLLRIASEHSSVVAVVGRGHLQGIKKNWNQTINIKELMELPTNESIFTVKNILKYMVVVVVGTAIVSGMYLAK
ncbi:unnamed protein product [Arabidopsis thaliana]|uniref:TraB family protein n=1 Tax=Arabidopsis thaliana TaxID=3702 RepID=A0A654EY45_ARATH|nr:unnamed protein product [Arabidopsis thaliana]